MNGRLRPRRTRSAALAFLLTFALLVCHGAMGSLHLPPETAVGEDAVGGSERHASHGANHHGDEDGGLLAAHHEAEVEYFAVLSLFFLAALFFSIRPRFERLPASFVAAGRVDELRNAAVPHFPRGSTLSRLQVFRL